MGEYYPSLSLVAYLVEEFWPSQSPLIPDSDTSFFESIHKPDLVFYPYPCSWPKHSGTCCDRCGAEQSDQSWWWGKRWKERPELMVGQEVEGTRAAGGAEHLTGDDKDGSRRSSLDRRRSWHLTGAATSLRFGNPFDNLFGNPPSLPPSPLHAS
jgi:hypothetical protein